MTSKDIKLKKLQKYDFMHIKQKLVTQVGNVKTNMVYIIDLLVTSNDPLWPQNWKLKNYNFMYIKWKLVTQAI